MITVFVLVKLVPCKHIFIIIIDDDFSVVFSDGEVVDGIVGSPAVDVAGQAGIGIPRLAAPNLTQ